MSEKTIFAKRLKEARIKAGMTQADIAAKTNMTAASISAYENADGTKGKNPSLENAKAIAESLGVSLDWLSGANNPVPSEYDSFASGCVCAYTLIKLLTMCADSGLCTITESHIEDEGYNPYLEKIVPITLVGSNIEFFNGFSGDGKIIEILNGIGKLVELKNNKLLPEKTYKLSIDAIIEKSRHIFIDFNNHDISAEKQTDTIIDDDGLPF